MDPEQYYEELEEVGTEIVKSFEINNDEEIEKIISLTKEVDILLRSRVEELKNELEDYQAQHDQLMEMNQDRHSLEKKQFSVIQDNKQLEEMCERLALEEKEMSTQKQLILLEKEKSDSNTQKLIPQKRTQFRLYGQMSNIRLVTETDQVKGYISSENDVKPFCFDSNKCSQQYIIDSLWDMI